MKELWQAVYLIIATVYFTGALIVYDDDEKTEDFKKAILVMLSICSMIGAFLTLLW